MGRIPTVYVPRVISSFDHNAIARWDAKLDCANAQSWIFGVGSGGEMCHPRTDLVAKSYGSDENEC